jgi:hypothetical protein
MMTIIVGKLQRKIQQALLHRNQVRHIFFLVPVWCNQISLLTAFMFDFAQPKKKPHLLMVFKIP